MVGIPSIHETNYSTPCPPNQKARPTQSSTMRPPPLLLARRRPRALISSSSASSIAGGASGTSTSSSSSSRSHRTHPYLGRRAMGSSAAAAAASSSSAGTHAATAIDMGDGVVDQVRAGCARCPRLVCYCRCGLDSMYHHQLKHPNAHTPPRKQQIGAKHRQVIGPRTLVVCPRLGGPEEPHVQRVLARLRGVRAFLCLLPCVLTNARLCWRRYLINVRLDPGTHTYVNITGGHPVRDLLHAGALPDHAGQSSQTYLQPIPTATDPSIHPPPHPQAADEGATIAKRMGAQSIVGVGGGGVLDLGRPPVESIPANDPQSMHFPPHFIDIQNPRTSNNSQSRGGPDAGARRVQGVPARVPPGEGAHHGPAPHRGRAHHRQVRPA